MPGSLLYDEKKYKVISWKSSKKPDRWYSMDPIKIKVVFPKQVYDKIRNSNLIHNPFDSNFEFEAFIDNNLFKMNLTSV